MRGKSCIKEERKAIQPCITKEKTMAKLSFGQWMQKVNSALVKKCGMDSRDLQDFAYRDAYDNGESPSLVVKQVLASQDF